MKNSLASALLCALLLAACTGTPVKVTEEETFTIGDAFTILSIKSPVGSIDVNKPGASDNVTGNATAVQAKIVKFAYGLSEEDALQDLSRITVTHQLDNATCKIIVDIPSGDPSFNGGADVILDNVPPTQVIIEGAVGDIACDETAGGTITTDVGTVTVDKATDAIDITVETGTIEVKEFSGAQFNVQTTTGDAGIHVVGEGKVAGTAATITGDLSLGLSASLSCTVDAATTTGDISVEGIDDYDRDDEVPGINERVSFTLNEGEGTVTGTVVTGSIAVQVQ